MKTRNTRRFWSILLALVMVVSLLPAAAVSAEQTSTWTSIALEDITASDTIAITMTKGDTTWVLPAANTSSAPKAAVASVSGTELTTVDADYGWTFTAVDGGYQITNAEGKYLYTTNANNGVRVGTTQMTWSLDESGYLKATAGTTVRYLGVYTANPDWRAYANTTGNTAGQTLGLWKLTSTQGDPDEPVEVPLSTISEALAGAAGTQFKVQGVVTMVDARNIYVQDATGGICLYFDTAVSDLALGDTVIFTGSRTTYKGLPELTGQTYEKSSGLTLAAKETTIGALTTADVCTYVQLTGLEVTEVFDNNGAYTSPNVTLADETGATIQLYKAVVGKTDGAWDVSVGDTVSVTAAVGINNSTLQLRNTLASEIVVTAHAPDEPSEGETYGLASTLETGDTVILYNASNGVAVGNTIASHKITGVALTPADGVITTDNEAVAWTVTKNADGTCTFTQGDYTLGGVVSGTYNNLVVTDATSIDWTLTGPDSSDFNYFLYLGGMTSSYGSVYLEYYNGFTLYGSSAPDKAAFGITFYKKGAEPETPSGEQPPVEGEDYGLASTLNTGDTVILYNADKGVAVGNAIASHKITGVALTPADGVITTDNEAVAWTVTKNADGTYTFTQGDYTLGGVVSGTYNNLVVTGASYTAWTLTGPDSTDFNYFMYLGEMATNYGHLYLEYYNGFTLYGSSAPDKAAFGVTFYKKGAEPETPSGEQPGEAGDLVTSLSQLTDGTTVAIYSPTHQTAISTKPNGDWYLKANAAAVENGKVVNFTSDFVWKVKVNSDGTYSFYSNNDETQCISVWPSGTYAELTVNPDYNSETVHDWALSAFSSENHTWYFKSSTLTITKNNTALPVYIEAYLRNGTEVFSGYAPYANQLTNTDYALQFYLVDPADAVTVVDDGEWDGVLTPGEQYVAYNAEAAASLGLFKEANYALDAIPTAIEGGLAKPGNGAYAFTVGSMGRYYSFEVNGKYLATNDSEEMLFVDGNEDGTIPETAKWYLVSNDGGYIIYNKEANYKGSPVCIEYYSSVFSGWTFKPATADIFRFSFYQVAADTIVYENVVQAPSVIFDCEDSRYVEQDYKASFSLDDLAESIDAISISFTAGGREGAVEDYEVSSDGKSYSFTIPAAEIDGESAPDAFTITVRVTNSFGITYTGEKRVAVIDEPFFEDLTPAPNSQTRDDKRPVVSVKIGNAGENPTVAMTINGEAVEAVFADGVLSYTPAEDMADGRVTVAVTVTRADGVTAEKSWNFTVGIADYQLYFGQLHSHTTYSDGSGTLETALEYIASLPESANIQFVAFTDHSNYFDTTSAANPADALNDKSLMTDASRALWQTYKDTVAAFNASHIDLVALAGFEMTWSGGPGHINTFDSDGLVSRNNNDLNNKSGDAGMKLYYETINKGSSLSQFNHPGSTFGNFTDFSYRDEETDEHMFLVEVGNGEGQIGAGGYYPSYEQYIIALDKGWHVAPTNNQDNHKGRWGNANDARDVVLTNDFSEAGIYDAIRNLRVYATEDKNLQINYTVNDEPMGAVFTDEQTPETLQVMVTVYDPDSSDAISKVELVSDGGVTAYTWDNSTELAAGQLTAEISPDYSYYFVRVTQRDGDLAVTAPVWVGNAVKLGITEFKAVTEPVYKDEEATLVTTLHNNESTAATLKSLTYTINGSEVIGSDTTSRTLAAGSTLDVSFAHTFTTAKLTTVTVTAVITLDGKEYTYTANVELDVLDKATADTVTPIADVRAASDPANTGYRFVIEGVVTSNASGYDKDTAFFDCIYVQDETAGICCFPVSGEFKIGDKVHIVGHTDFYQGEPELQVVTIELLEGEGSVEPAAVTAAQINDRSAEGSLVTITGAVESFEYANELIQTVMVRDENDNVARVFIDGYITTAEEVKDLVVGCQITATGLASYDDTWADTDAFPRIRIRSRADVVCTNYHPEIANYRDPEITAPVKDGFLFGGWYQDEALTQPVAKETLSGAAYAKWVDAKLLNVAWQIKDGTGPSSETTDVRLVTTVDCLDYDSVGFLFGLAGKKQQTAVSKSVYSKIKGTVNGETVEYTPADAKDSEGNLLFSESSRYFLTRSFTGIPATRFDSDMTARAFWVTADGTRVEGAVKTFRISDDEGYQSLANTQ